MSFWHVNIIMKTNEFNLIMPVSIKDVNTALKNITYIKKYINPKRIVVISNSSVLLSNKQVFTNENVEFLDENRIIPGLTYNHVKELLSKYHAEERTGWYFQQFLKMAYSYISPYEFYVSWDADTIPLKQVNFFDSYNKPVFSLKDEYNKAYFETIYSIFGIEKKIEKSFICEHMIFNKEIMREIISKISECNPLNYWFDNIIANISKDALKASGFSEFETYGTYVLEYHRDFYSFKDIITLRTGRRFFGDDVSQEVLSWLSTFYDAVSFEKWDNRYIYIYKCT